MFENAAIIVLAAGRGTRMKSNRAKVLHEITGRAMVTYVMDIAREIVGNRVVVVVGHQAEEVRKVICASYHAAFAFQERQLGTGHAVGCALAYLPAGTEQVLILYGDVPLLQAATLQRFMDAHCGGDLDLSILGVEMENPSGYGRLILDRAGNVREIVEEADADAVQKRIRLINTGIYCVRAEFLRQSLSRLKSDNAQGELYLTDIVAIAYRQGMRIGLVRHHDAEEVFGINTRTELAAAEKILQRRLRFQS